MSLPRRFDQPHPADGVTPYDFLGLEGPPPPPARAAAVPRRVDWKAWLRTLDRKRRQLAALAVRHVHRPAGPDVESGESSDAPEPPQRVGNEHPEDRQDYRDRRYLALVTQVSFEMDGIAPAPHEAATALGRGAARRPCRSRQAQRIRNHIAILRRVGALVRRGQPLEAGAVVRWYTSISCGLSSALLDEPTLSRLAQVVRQINSPHLNLRPALEGSAALYLDLLQDPIVPSFNGILARLLLTCQLGRCGLPPALFDPNRDRTRPDSAAALLPRLLEMIHESYDALLAVRGR